MDEDNLLVCNEFLGLLAIESAAEEQNRDDENDGRQKFVRWVKLHNFILN